MRYEAYTAADFLLDESFKDWVKKPSPASEQYWQSFINSFPDKKQEIALAREIILSAHFQKDWVTPEETAEVYDKILKEKTSEYAVSPTQSKHTHFFPWYWNVAAILIVLLGSILWLAWDDIQQVNTTEPVMAEHRVVKENPRGQKHQFSLPDGSIVWLNAESRLEYPEPFSPEKREVVLQGEAFFEVKSNKNRPFVIKTGDVTTTVVGTSFNITAFPEDQSISVSVASGQVRVDTKNAQNILLHPTEQANYQKESASMTKTNFDPLDILGWKDGLIYFKEASFPEIVAELERWYDIEIKVDDMQKYRRFSGEFRKQSLETVLNGISFSLDFDFRIEGKDVFIFTK